MFECINTRIQLILKEALTHFKMFLQAFLTEHAALQMEWSQYKMLKKKKFICI